MKIIEEIQNLVDENEQLKHDKHGLERRLQITVAALEAVLADLRQYGVNFSTDEGDDLGDNVDQY